MQKKKSVCHSLPGKSPLSKIIQRKISFSELEKQISAKSALAKTARTNLVETEHQLKDLWQIPNLDVEKLRSDYNTLYSKKETLRKPCQSAEKDVTSFTRKLDKLNQYLDRTPAQQEPADRKFDKNQQSL